jgi:HEAT repeat protein
MAFTESFISAHWIPMALGEMKAKAAPALPILVKALQHPKAEVRMNGLDGLGSIGPVAKQHLPLIVKLMKDLEEDVRWRAVEALPKVGGATDQVIRVLAEALEDKGQRRYVASSAADILWRLNRAPTVALPELIRSVMRYDPPGTTGYSRLSDIRSSAAKAIGNIGPAAREAVPALIPMLKSEEACERAAAAGALGKIGPAAKKALPVLKREMRGDWTRLYYAEAIKRIKK